MGWSAVVRADKAIAVTDVEAIMAELPEHLRGGGQAFGATRQIWGWSSGVDVSNPVGSVVELSGSFGISGGIAKEFAAHFRRSLKARGYTVRTQFHW
jgi:hypothetical protein